MASISAQLETLGKLPGGKGLTRVLSELRFLQQLMQVEPIDRAPIERAIASLSQSAFEHGAVNDDMAQAAEAHLMPLAEAAKRYTILCVGHAHIDMNWMWSYSETVSITLETVRTVLSLMREFPAFTFAQSQASVYRIVEEFAPEMLPEIRQRVAEGRWEVSASTWVEADRNMSSAESVARHHLYTRRYLSELLELKGDSLFLDYEPDTFGHGAHTPEMLAQAGVRYYYHCRGFEDHHLYRWRSPSGAEVLALREPFWYLGAVEHDIADFAPDFYRLYGLRTFLHVYGVGDHGGGPTRRDLRRIEEMAGWPVFPQIVNGTYAQFFAQAESVRENLPVVTGELNPVFTGCYTTQSRIKWGNRMGEKWLAEAEMSAAAAHVKLGVPYRTQEFEQGWRGVLFNQFHDILPGSGVIDTREHALGLYQQSFAVAQGARFRALHAFADAIDTSSLKAPNADDDTAQGAGVGFGLMRGAALAQVERGYGAKRIFHLFNPSAFARTEVVQLTIWDWQESLDQLMFADHKGEPVRHQVMASGHNAYWGHDYTTVLLEASVPPLGYATFTMEVNDQADFMPYAKRADPRVERLPDLTMENEFLTFTMGADPSRTGTLLHKQTGQTAVLEGFLRQIEDPSLGMTAWTRGALRESAPLTILKVRRADSGPLYNAIHVTASAGACQVEYKLILRAGSPVLEIEADINWRELGCLEKGMPTLCYQLRTAPGGHPVYDIPGGQVSRAPVCQDMPGIRFVSVDGDLGSTMLLSDSKYGYRAYEDVLSVTLLRSATEPDPIPEMGMSKVRLGVALSGKCPLGKSELAQRFAQPLETVSGTVHPGTLPLSEGFLEAKGGIELTCMKLSEDQKALIVRGIELLGKEGEAALHIHLPFEKAFIANTHEEAVAEIAAKDGMLSGFAKPYGMFTLRLEL